MELKDFLKIALMPIGKVLYVYGGGWNLSDTGAGEESTSIGISEKWVDFFNKNNEDYDYKNYYPSPHYNPYYYAGLDCSGYLGWVLYNIMEGKKSYVFSSTKIAKVLAKDYGDFSKDTDFKTGDIFSMEGHVWICVGVCNDKSMVILHSTPSPSITNALGGGVQLSSVGQKNCQAYFLAKKHMETFYPFWSKRYKVQALSFEKYTKMENDDCGRFSWDESLMKDENGYRNMVCDDILYDLFKM